MRRILFFTLLFFVGAASAQISDSLYNALPDTLRPKTKTHITDEEIIRIVQNNTFAFTQAHYTDFNKLQAQLEQNINRVADKNERIMYADAITILYLAKADNKKAFEWNNILVKNGESATKYGRNISTAYLNMAMYLSGDLQRPDSAIGMLHKALHIANTKAVGDSEVLSNVYIGYAQIYRNMFLYNDALQYCNKFFATVPVEKKWRSTYTNIYLFKAQIFCAMLRQEQPQQAYADSVLRLVNDVMAVKKNESQYYYFICYVLSAFVHQYQSNYILASKYYDSAFLPKYNTENAFHNNYKNIYAASRCVNQMELGNSNAVNQLVALPLPQRKFYTQRADIQLALYNYYNKRGDSKNALKYYIEYRKLLDSIDVTTQKGKVFEAEQKYSVAQKEADIAVLENKNLLQKNRQNKIVILAISLLFLFAVCMLLLYLANKKQKNQRLQEQKKMMDELHSMEQELELERLAQKAEQEAAIAQHSKTISHNMHDEVNSGLAGLRYLIADFKRGSNGKTNEMLSVLEEEANNVYLQSREFMHNLSHQTSSNNYDVNSLLQNMAKRFGHAGFLQVFINADEDEIKRTFTPAQHYEVYNIIKEAVANSLKHAGASTIHVNIKINNGNCELSINDNGKGIKQKDLNNGLGMESLQKRMAILKGELEIKSSDDGTMIIGKFPC